MIYHICRNVVLSASAVLYKELYCFNHCTCMPIIIYKKIMMYIYILYIYIYIIYIYIYIYIYVNNGSNKGLVL